MLPQLPRRTLKDLQRNQFKKSCLLFVREREPSEPALVPCTLSAVDKRSKKKKLTCTNIHTNTHANTRTEKVKAPYARMRSDVKRLFFLGTTRKIGSALRASRAPVLLYI